MRFVMRGLLAVVAILTLLAGGFVWWGSTPQSLMPEVSPALVSSEVVQVQQDRWLVFRPAAGALDTGFVFYPGGRVDHRAYAPLARDIAARGYLVVIVPMPLNLAVLGIEQADQVISSFPEIDYWAVGGHSLGGAMAAQYVAQNPGRVEGLVLWAAYPAESSSLVDSGLKVTSIYGSEDGLATGTKIAGSRPLLPVETRWVEIAGGNHAQFGWYGDQDGDGEASISRAEQQLQVVDATDDLLSRLP